MRRRLRAVLAASAIALVACGSGAGPTDTTGAVADPPPASAQPSPGVTGGDPSAEPAPDRSGEPHGQLAFQAPLLGGGTFDGQVSGDVILWFWAPW